MSTANYDEILDKAIRRVPDFPKPGILFYDITSVLTQPAAFKYCIRRMVELYKNTHFDAVAAVESRGFLFAAPFAQEMDLPLVLIRKKGKLPYKTISQEYDLEYGKAEIQESEIQQDSCEIADYQLQETVMTVQSEIGKGIYDDSSSTEIADHYSLAPIRFQLDSNPFLDGFAAGYSRGDSAARYGNMHVLVDGLYYFHHRMRTAADPDTTIQRAEFRPFSCTVHSEQRFHLGQKIGIHHQGSYYESEITSAIWNFRGGWVLSCAGADSRCAPHEPG